MFVVKMSVDVVDDKMAAILAILTHPHCVVASAIFTLSIKKLFFLKFQVLYSKLNLTSISPAIVDAFRIVVSQLCLGLPWCVII